MLSRAAARAATGRTVRASFCVAPTARWLRGYAKDNKPHRPPKKPSPFEASPNVGSARPPSPSAAKDHTWKPNEPIRFGAGSAAAAAGSGTASSNAAEPQSADTAAQETAELDAGARPERNTAPTSQPGPGVTERAAPKNDATAESVESQEVFGNSQSPDANEAPSSSPTQSSESGTAEQPTLNQPLPDLRQGIPSTFDAEFGFGKQEPPAKPETPQDPDLNATEDAARSGQPTPASSGGSGGREGGELPRSAYETSTDRRRNKVANYMYAIFGLLGVTGAAYLGRNWDDEKEAAAHPDIPSGWRLRLFYDRAKARLNTQMGYYTEPTFPKLLPTVDPAPPYTLVLSMEDLMIHSEWSREYGWRTAKRPGIDYFLRYLSQYYELVLFTSLPSMTADPVYRKLDPFRIIMWPLFREATRYEKGEYIKDLSYLNRPLSKVILIDTNPAHAKLQPENAIIIPKWKGDPKDRELVSLIPFLEYVATMSVGDVREAIKSFEGKHIPTEFAIREAKAREEFNKQLAEEKAKRPKRSLMGSLTKSLGMTPQPAPGSMVLGEESAAQGFEQGKMLSDQIRERGRKQYEALEKEIRENGAKWLAEMEAEEKKAQEEQMKSMKSGFTGWFGGGATKA